MRREETAATQIERRLLRMTVTVLACLLLAGGLALLYFTDPEEKGFLPCPLYTLCHVYCPGCGAARALHSLLHGQLYQAVRYNVAFVVLFPFLLAYGGAVAADFSRDRPIRIHRHLPQPLLYGILAALAAYGVLRNVIPWLQPAGGLMP